MTDTLNLGAGNRIIDGAVNHDLTLHRPEITVAHDLNDLPWPWPDDSFDHIEAWAVLEHLRITLLVSLAGCWRILRVGGVLNAKLPLWNHDMSWADPTHFWKFSLVSLDQFDPDTERGAHYAYYTPRKWKIILPATEIVGSASFQVQMTPRKP